MIRGRSFVFLVLAVGVIGILVAIAASPSGVPADVWSLKGNRGTDAATDFLGTTDNAPLIVKTNSAPVLTLGTTGPVEVHKTLVVHSDATVDRNLRVGGDFSAAGAVSVSGPLTLTGNAAIEGDLFVSGHARFAQDAHVAGSLTADGPSQVGGVTLSSGTVQTTSLSVVGTVTATTVDVSGTTRTGVLEITGGDLAEPFTISNSEAVPAGTVLVINDKSEGHLRVSDAPYDRRVAGIVSGAGGILPGVVMYRQASSTGARHLALAGRVYALADASNGAITPGDLLTTSASPGHVMRVTDHQRAQGAVIGKAMSSLAGGHGLVLVLVSLQ